MLTLIHLKIQVGNWPSFSLKKIDVYKDYREFVIRLINALVKNRTFVAHTRC